MSELTYISAERVLKLLEWGRTYEAVKSAMESVAKNRALQNPRTIIKLPNTDNLFFTMPGCLSDEQYGALACKLVSYFPGSSPSTTASIMLMDDQTGRLKAVIDGTDITDWRTAAASAVATEYLYCNRKPKMENKVLAVLGAGAQGAIHAAAFQHFFKFSEVRVWNRTPERAKRLVEKLSGKSSGTFIAHANVEECVRDADVIVTATPAREIILQHKWLKEGVHINAIGVGPGRELDDAAYKACDVYIDNWAGAKNELKGIEDLGVEFKGQIGDLITGSLPPPQPKTSTIFQSLGMAVEDCAMARLIYDLHGKSSS